jgi:hypothetical protein
MKKMIWVSLLVFSSFIFAQNKGQLSIEKDIETVKNFLNKQAVDEKSLTKSCIRLENFTDILCQRNNDFKLVPTRQNFRNWKKWYRENKNSISYDEAEKLITRTISIINDYR